jgi:N-acetylneuraminic acid mutarotase
MSHSMCYDSHRQRTILFGGDSLRNSSYNDTWEWDGELWTQVADRGPGARRYPALAYDAKRQRTIFFGGIVDDQMLGDTWQWDGEDWTQLTNSGPAPRYGHAMVYNEQTERIVLFGGTTARGILSDTWEFNGEEWTQLEDTGPVARTAHAMAYDPIRRCIVLFGGNGVDDTTLGDTWEWTGSRWVQAADFGPEPRAGTTMAFMKSQVVLFGGTTVWNPNPRHRIFGDTWTWDGERWTQRQDIGPGQRWAHAMVFDSHRSRAVVFGGLPGSRNSEREDEVIADKLYGDTWEHHDTSPAPPPREMPFAVQSLTLSPSTVPASQVPNVEATVTLVTPAASPVSIVIGFAAQRHIENPPPEGIPRIPVTDLYFPAGTLAGTVRLGTTAITESGVLFLALDEPHQSIEATLTVTEG